jgi:hypothetical protein
MNVNPYDWDPAKVPADALAPSFSTNGEEDDQPKLTTKAEAVTYYRHMKTVRLAPGEESADPNGGPPSNSPGRRHVSKKHGSKASQAQTPLFMRILNSALMVLNQNQQLVPQGQYAWELIYPQQTATGFPCIGTRGNTYLVVI